MNSTTWGIPETEKETTVTEYEYDDDGRVVKETRTVTKTINRSQYNATWAGGGITYVFNQDFPKPE